MGLKHQGNKEKWGCGSLGAGERASQGDCEPRSLRAWELGNMGTRELGSPKSWEPGSLKA